MREMQSDKKRNTGRSILIAGAFSFLFSAAILFGARLDSVENVDVKDGWLWVSVLVLTILFTGLVRLLWLFLDLAQAKCQAVKTDAEKEAQIEKVTPNKITYVLEWTDQHAVALSFFVLLLCWLPVFLAVYPGFFVYDAQDE